MTAVRDAVVQRTVVVPVSIDRAFDFFAHHMIEWWPGEFTFSEEFLESITLETRSGGRWYETDTSGNETGWGTVHEYSAPNRLRLSWKISPERTPEPDESRASDLTVTFVEQGDAGTRVDVEHSRFDRHADGAEIMLAGMDSAEGWTKILDRYASRIVDISEHAF